MPAKVFLDANILYSRTLRDWTLLLQVEAPELLQLCWTEDILSEAIYRLRRNHLDWDGKKLSTYRDRWAEIMAGGRIDSYPARDDYPGPDPNDAHLHSAAVAGNVDYVLTCDRKFVPSVKHDLLDYEIYQPDEFFVLVNDNKPHAVRAVTHKQLRHVLERHGEADLPGRLRSNRCPHFADIVRGHLQSIKL